MTLQTISRQIQQNFFRVRIILPIGVGLLIGAACVLLPPSTVLLGVAGALSLLIIAFKPEFGILVIVVITSNLVNPDNLPLLKAGGISFHISDLILLFLLAKVVVTALISRKVKLIQTPLDFPAFWFCLASILSVFIAISNPSSGIDFIFRRFRPIAYYLIFFAVTNLIVNKRQLFTLVYGLVIIAVLASTMMLIQIIFPSVQIIPTRELTLITAGQDFSGVERTYFQGDRVIYLLLMVILTSLIIKGKLFPSWLEFILVGVIGIGEILTFQRNYWLTIISIAILLFFIVSRIERIRFIRWLILSVVLLAIMFNFPGFPIRYWNAAVDRLSRGMQLETLVGDTSTQYRVDETKAAIQSIIAKPVLGIGLGNFYRPAFQFEDPTNVEENLRWYIHNSYLWVWIDMGLIGLIPFLWFYLAAIIKHLLQWRRIRDSKLQAVMLGGSLGILGQSISNLVAPNFIQTWILVIFPIVIGMNEVILRLDSIEKIAQETHV
jgi:O-antigen ligase